MDASFTPKDEIWFLRVCHHISTDLHLITYSMEQSYSWEANRFSASEEITRILWNPNNNNNNYYLLQLGCHPVAVVILHVHKIWNWLLINLSR